MNADGKVEFLVDLVLSDPVMHTMENRNGCVKHPSRCKKPNRLFQENSATTAGGAKKQGSSSDLLHRMCVADISDGKQQTKGSVERKVLESAHDCFHVIAPHQLMETLRKHVFFILKQFKFAEKLSQVQWKRGQRGEKSGSAPELDPGHVEQQPGGDHLWRVVVLIGQEDHLLNTWAKGRRCLHPAGGSKERFLVSFKVRTRQTACGDPPAWMMSLAHSLQGNRATYMVQPFTSALFLFMMAFSSAWHTGGHGDKRHFAQTGFVKEAFECK